MKCLDGGDFPEEPLAVMMVKAIPPTLSGLVPAPMAGAHNPPMMRQRH